MLRILNFFGLVSLVLGVGAQTPYLPPVYNSLPSTHNFVRSYTVLKPGLTAEQIVQDSRTPLEVQLSTEYFDGLGRPIQSVVRQGSLNTAMGITTATDVVKLHTYDDFGREVHQYLPYVHSGTDGQFKGAAIADPTGIHKNNPVYSPFAQQAAFYEGSQSPIINQSEDFFYGKTIFENSPLNRVLAQFAPGDSWVKTEGQSIERSVRQGYYFNTSTDAVRIWNVGDNGTVGVWGTYSTPSGVAGIYPAGQLYKNITTDEHGKQVIEFKDKSGQVILKKVQLTDAIDNGNGSGHEGWICTYYIYDDFGSLRCVVQPEGVKWLANPVNDWNLSNSTILNEQCFRYEYDARRRMVLKKVPGAAEVIMIYDNRDRLVLTQDGNQRLMNKWLYTWYDKLNRPIATGLWTNSNTGEVLRAEASLVPDNAYYNYYPSSAQDELTRTEYDDYSKLNDYYDHGLTAAYYNEDGFDGENNLVFPYVRPQQVSIATQGLITFTRVKIVGTSNWITNLILYDNYGRVLQTSTSNPFLNTIDIVTSQYGFAGQIFKTVNRQILNGPNPQAFVVVTKYEFDAIGRVKEIKKQQSHSALNNGQLSQIKTIARMWYDAMGNLRKRDLGTNAQQAPLETLNYDYNIRGWLLGVNRDFVATANTAAPTAGKWFGFDLGYDKTANPTGHGYFQGQFNGNISGQSWRSAGDNAARQYHYSYDAANRLLLADFVQRQTFESGFSKSFNFDSKMGADGLTPETAYDLNGNIKKMQQWGWTISSPNFKLDDLTYNYGMGSTVSQTLSSKLTSVTDEVLEETGLGDFVDKSVWYDDYSYDENGNLLEDRNKRIESISYNILNLPEVVVFLKDGGIKGRIEYKYTASGVKMEKVVTENTVVGGYSAELISKTIYANHVVYEEIKEYVPRYSSYNTIKPFGISFISHEEGRIRCLRTIPMNQVYDFVYDYMLKDHLGNVRMVLTEEQLQNNYPDATMEDAAIANESKYYSNLYNTKVTKPSWFTDPMYSTNSYVARLRNNSTSQKVGPSILLKVMAGDSYNIRVAAGWKSSSVATNSSTNILSSLVGLLSGSIPPISAGKATSGGLQSSGLGLEAAILGFMQGQPVTPNKPKAYLAWLLFDEQFKVAASGSVLITNNSNPYLLSNLPVKKSGYLFVYTSNEATNIDVFFDNLKVTHVQGPLLEETHYYPFGLTMAGISSKASGKLENKFKYIEKEIQNKEFTDGSGLDLYDFGARFYDAQIGRWHVQDPRVDKWPEYTPYVYTLNNPISLVDIDGEDVYILYYTTGNEKGDEMFKAAAETRKKDIESGKKFNAEKDKVIMIGVSDISDVQGMTKWAVDTYSEKYGKTAEVGVWSHSGVDGPIGTQATKKDALYEGSKQMSLDGWGKIDFNWKDKGTTMGFYGCNSANETASKNFAQNISGLSNYQDVEVRGQSTSSYPSFYTNYRVTSIARNYNMAEAWQRGPNGAETYLVGGNAGEGKRATANVPFTGSFPKANPMNVYRNRQKLRSDYQPGRQKK